MGLEGSLSAQQSVGTWQSGVGRTIELLSLLDKVQVAMNVKRIQDT